MSPIIELLARIDDGEPHKLKPVLIYYYASESSFIKELPNILDVFLMMVEILIIQTSSITRTLIMVTIVVKMRKPHSGRNCTMRMPR